jgi:hypothetical protein
MDFDQEFFDRFMKPGPIPDLLHSVYEKGPFSRCTVCDGDLAGDTLYEIQKVFRGREVVFEMAVCQQCAEGLVREFSEESLANIHGFLRENFRPSATPTHCHFCGFPRDLIQSFSVAGACRGSSLILPSFLMCETCTERLQEKLSRKTRDVQGDFIRDHFPGVPADLDLSPSFSGLLT